MFSLPLLGGRVVAQAAAFAYFSARAIVDPNDGDAVAAVGELSAVSALERMRDEMMGYQSGRYILQVQPHVKDELLVEARQMPPGTFGWHYAAYMDHNKFLPGGRTPVKHIEDPLLAYIMTRYRQCHDFLHTCADCGRTVHEEVAVKMLEYQHTGLPLGLLALPGGAVHFTDRDRRMVKVYWRWAQANAPRCTHGEPVVPFYLSHLWEDMLALQMEEVLKITGITPLPKFLAEMCDPSLTSK